MIFLDTGHGAFYSTVADVLQKATSTPEALALPATALVNTKTAGMHMVPR